MTRADRLRDAADTVAEFNAMCGMPLDYPCHPSDLRYEADQIGSQPCGADTSTN